MIKMKKIITKAVLILSVISLFTDIASEMLYPVMPLYLKSIGFSVFLIGILEGLAEATAGLSKGYFGKLSDNMGKRVPFVQLGYSLSAISKPMLGIFAFPIWIFLSRTVDRLGKGIRTGARDALLSDETTPEHKGKVFGFHRALDTFGAFLGPVAALIYLYFFPNDYVNLFFIAFIPGVIAIALTFLLKEKPKKVQKEVKRTSLLSFVKYWRQSHKDYRKLSGGMLVFTLFNSSDVFLLLMLKEQGLSDSYTIGAYIFYNLIYALFSYPFGSLGDKIGMKKTLTIGLLFYVVVYLGFGLNTYFIGFIALFFLYGLYAAATEGISKAWITNICKKEDSATAIGTFTAFQSILTMLASAFAGLIWQYFGAAATFSVTAVAAACVLIYFIFTKFELAH